EGKTMIFVSHSIGQMKQFCEKILWLEYGMVKDYGTVEEVIPKYESFLKKWKSMNKKALAEYKKKAFIIKEKKLKEQTIKNEIYINEFIVQEDKNPNEMTQKPVSMLWHFNAKASYIYDTPESQNVISDSEKYKSAVYYIKRKFEYNKELLYLIS